MIILMPGQSTTYLRVLRDQNGNAANADALPTASLYKNGAADNTIAVVLAGGAQGGAVGEYTVSFITPPTYASGDIGQLRLQGMISGTTFDVLDDPMTCLLLATEAEIEADMVSAVVSGAGQVIGTAQGLTLWIDNPPDDPNTLILCQNDAGVRIRKTLRKPDGEPINLTGCAIAFHLRLIGATLAQISAACSIAWAEGGVVDYVTIPGDLAVTGTGFMEWQVTDGSGNITTYPLQSRACSVQIIKELG